MFAPEAANPSTAAASYSIEQVLSPYMGVFFVAFIVSLLATPAMTLVALRLGIVDKPDLHRKVHQTPTAYLGGVALFIGWLAGVLVSYGVAPHWLHAGAKDFKQLVNTGGGVSFPLAVILGAFVVVGIGLWDDVKSIRPRYKLMGQVLAAGILISQGVGMRVVSGSLSALGGAIGVDFSFLPQPVVMVLGALLVVFFILGGCNSANLMDGLDGLASGVTAVVTLGLIFLSLSLAVGWYATEGGAYSNLGDSVRMVLCLALFGAVMGFLPYNFKPATIFMGDAGSMLLGYLSVCTILMLGEKGDPLLVMAGLIVFTIPILDTALAIVRRVARRMPISVADNHHLHHLLMRAGLGVRQSVIVLYLLTMGFAVLGCSMMFIRLRFVAAVFMVIFCFVAIMAYKIGHRMYLIEQAAEEAAAPDTPRAGPSPAPASTPTRAPASPPDTAPVPAFAAAETLRPKPVFPGPRPAMREPALSVTSR